MTEYKILETTSRVPKGRFQTVMSYYGDKDFGFAELRVYDKEIILITQVLKKNKIFIIEQVKSGGDFKYGSDELPRLLEKLVLTEFQQHLGDKYENIKYGNQIS